MTLPAPREVVRPPIEIELLPAAASDDGQLMERIAELANEVYAVAEDGLWTDGATRTTVEEVAELTRAAQIAVARLRTMRLEVLVPRDWTHPTKEFLAAWYTRIGYRIARSGTIDEAYPALAPLLATPCDFVIYHKDLAVGPGGRDDG
jgi:hypothetical protein